MENIYDFFRKKPIFLVLFFGIIFILILLNRYLTNSINNQISSSQTNISSNENNTKNISKEETKNVTNANGSVPAPISQTLTTDQFTLDYPQDWKKQFMYKSGGVAYSFQPSSIGQEEYYPLFQVQVVPLSKSATVSGQMEQLTVPFNLIKEATVFGGFPAVKWEGQFDIPAPSLGSVTKKVIVVFFHLDTSSYDYLIKYAYYESKADTDLPILLNILNSIKLQ